MFSIYLPRHVGDSDRPHVTGTVEPAACGNETILLVEDEMTLLNMISTMLENLGYTVMKANTPSDATRQIDDGIRQIDLLLTDVIMPEMNGRDLAKKLLTKQPRMKCLFMSGYTADIIANQGVLRDGVGFIQKPFSKRELAEKVRNALGS